MSKTAVVILNWNGRQFLGIFLRMIVERSVGAEVWIADNGSTDGSIEYLTKNFPEVHLLQLDKNYGYTGGYNKALESIDADYYVLLNSDIEVTPGWLTPMISLMDENPKVAAVQPKILSFAEKDRFEYAGASGGFIDMLGYPFCRGRFIGQKTEYDKGQYDDAREIFWATGAAMMVRGSVFHSIGGLDENFFAHMEEIDLCWRMKRGGYKIMVEPSSVVYHVGGGTLPIWSPMKTYLNFRNNISMLYKNLSKRKFTLTYSIRIVTDFLRVLSYVAQIKFKFAKAVIKGHCDFWRMRKNLNRQDNLGHKSVPHIYKGSIILRQMLGKGTFGKMMTVAMTLCLMSCSAKGHLDIIDVSFPEVGKLGETIHFTITEKETADSIWISVDGKRVSGNEYKTHRLGKIGYLVMAYRNGDIDSKSGTFNIITDRIPEVRNIEITAEYPHSTASYTQGLVYRNGIMYESAGQYTQSALLETDPVTGQCARKKELPKKYFAEGLEYIDGSLYQLTWQEKTCFKYDAATFQQTGKYSYKGEGWGLATDGERLYMSDGSSVIRIIDPASFKVISSIQVMDNHGVVKGLNELEWINGKIWANIYTKNWIAVIDPVSGEIETYINCSALEQRITHDDNTDVLNGIAYDSTKDRIFLTGKCWNKMFEIKVK